MNFDLWLMYAFAAPAFWAVNNVLDRAFMVRLIKNEYAITVAAGFTRLPMFLFLWALTGWFIPEIKILFLALLVGFFNVVPVIFYLKSLREEETPSVIILYDATVPLVIFLLSFFFLGERLNSTEAFGFFLIIGAGLLSSVKFGGAGSGLKLRKASMFWIILAGALWAPYDVALAWLLQYFPSAAALLAWLFLGGFLGSFVLLGFPRIRARCRLEDFRWGAQSWWFFALGTLVAFLGFWAFGKALTMERVTLTAVLSNIQPLFIFLFEIAACALSPIFQKSDSSFRSLAPKAAALMLLLVGVWLFQ